MFPMIWLLFGTVLVGIMMLMLPTESQSRVQPNGRELQVPRVFAADRVSLCLLVLAMDLVAASTFLVWPMDAFGVGRQVYFTVLLLSTSLSVAPVTCWLTAALISVSKPAAGDSE